MVGNSNSNKSDQSDEGNHKGTKHRQLEAVLKKFVTKLQTKKQNIGQMEAATAALKRLCREMPHYSPQHLALMYQKQLEYDQ